MIAKTIFNNIEEIVDNIYELAQKDYDEEYFLSLVVDRDKITYQIEDGWSSPYNYQILKFKTEKIRGLTRKELSEKLATDIVSGSNELYRSLTTLSNGTAKVLQEEKKDIIDELLKVENIPGTYYLSFYADNDFIEYDFNPSNETSFGYDIFDNYLKLPKEQFEIEISKKLDTLINEWKFLLENEFNWKINKI